MAEGGGLLNRYTVKSRIGGSNPPLSASFNDASYYAASFFGRLKPTERENVTGHL